MKIYYGIHQSARSGFINFRIPISPLPFPTRPRNPPLAHFYPRLWLVVGIWPLSCSHCLVHGLSIHRYISFAVWPSPSRTYAVQISVDCVYFCHLLWIRPAIVIIHRRFDLNVASGESMTKGGHPLMLSQVILMI